MPLKAVVNVKCPCCGEVLEIDVAKERVVAHRKGPHLEGDRKAGEDSLSVAFRNQKAVEDRTQNDFAAAAERLKKGDTELDRLFREAKKKSAEGKDGISDEDLKKRWD